MVFGIDGCEDLGPWPCHEDGCPSPSVSCSQLAGDCKRKFSQVFREPPPDLASPDAYIWEACPKTCKRLEKCGGAGGAGGAGGGADSRAGGADSKCVKWRQTSGCSATGKRQTAQDQECTQRIQSGWSGYCECEGGIRAGESTCEHPAFTCADKCAEQWTWLRQQREKKESAAGGGAATPESADDQLVRQPTQATTHSLCPDPQDQRTRSTASSGARPCTRWSRRGHPPPLAPTLRRAREASPPPEAHPPEAHPPTRAAHVVPERAPLRRVACGAQTQLYKRGKQFYVMGNTELALRHFREALKLDPEHKCKADYKQAKKLTKIMDKIEEVMGKDVEGKGRQKQVSWPWTISGPNARPPISPARNGVGRPIALPIARLHSRLPECAPDCPIALPIAWLQLEREEQYEEARVLLADALDLTPPAVYRSSLYRDLCICNTKTRKQEEAMSMCKKHNDHEGGSLSSRVLFAEALLLNEAYEEAIAEYKKVAQGGAHTLERTQ